MIGTIVGANLVNAAVPLPAEPAGVDPGVQIPVEPGTSPGLPSTPPVEPGPVEAGTPVDIGAGVVAYPPAGWTVVGSEPGEVVLGKGGAIVLLVGVPWTTGPRELAIAYRDAFFEAGELTGSEPESGAIGDGVPAVAIAYSGLLDGTPVDGAIITGATATTGVIVNVFGASGSLRGVGDDIDAMLATISVPGSQP
jgi:hypothetical protein